MISVYRLNIKITRSRNPSLNPARETFCSLCSQNGYSLPQATITIPFVRFCYAKPSKFEIPKFSPSLSPLVSPSPSQTLAGLSHSLSVSLSLSLSLSALRSSPHAPCSYSFPGLQKYKIFRNQWLHTGKDSFGFPVFHSSTLYSNFFCILLQAEKIF